MMRISKVEAQALATFVGRIRPDWDHPGIVAAIEKAAGLGTAAAIGAALCRLAENYDVRSPAILAETGRHWAGTTVGTRIPPTLCPEHPTERLWDCKPCASSAITDPDAIEAHAAAVRAEFHAHRHTTPRRESPTLADLSDAPTRAEGEQP